MNALIAEATSRSARVRAVLEATLAAWFRSRELPLADADIKRIARIHDLPSAAASYEYLVRLHSSVPDPGLRQRLIRQEMQLSQSEKNDTSAIRRARREAWQQHEAKQNLTIKYEKQTADVTLLREESKRRTRDFANFVRLTRPIYDERKSQLRALDLSAAELTEALVELDAILEVYLQRLLK